MKLLSDNDFIQFCGRQESQFLARPSDFRAEIRDRFAGVGGTDGDLLPWGKTHELVAMRPGEVSLWAGINGHGKSLLLSQVIAWILGHTSALVASLEMRPAATLHRMLRQCAGCENVSEGYQGRWLDWTDNRLWIYDQLDSVAPERILGMIHYAASELKIRHIVIDSLMKCGINGRSDAVLAGQKDFMDRLCWAAKTHNCHLHLVHHMRKGEKESKIPDKFDVKGAGELVDMADNLFIVHRNKKKELETQMGEEVDDSEPDCTLSVAKQRHGEWEGRIALYYHAASQQFVAYPDHGPIPYSEI